MKIKVQVSIESDAGELQCSQQVSQIDRGQLTSQNLGLTLQESKTILHNIQQAIAHQQVSEFCEKKRVCSDCGKLREGKGNHKLIYRTLFGKLELSSPRWVHCDCQQHDTKSYSPLALLFEERISPEYLYLETKYAALMSYGLTVKTLAEVLPIEQQVNVTGVRQNLLKMAARLDSELDEEQPMFIDGCPMEWAKLPQPDLPITMGIDGGYVHAYRQKENGEQKSFEVIAGKSIKDDGSAKTFGFVQTYDTKPKRRVFEVLKSQGMQMNQQVVFLSDGADNVRELQLYLNPQAEHFLDWFHITMRITVLGQYLKGVKHYDEKQGQEMEEMLKSIKWNLWHGNVFKALQKIEFLEMDAECLELDYPKLTKMFKHIREFHVYIKNNQNFITNYGARYRCGERISTGFVESSINQIVAKRMEKKQQMRWTPRGAHMMLQVRTKVLNKEWRDTFERWYHEDTNQEAEMPVAA